MKGLDARRLDGLSRSEVARLHANLRQTNGIYAANDALTLLRTLYTLAQEHEAETVDPQSVSASTASANEHAASTPTS